MDCPHWMLAGNEQDVHSGAVNQRVREPGLQPSANSGCRIRSRGGVDDSACLAFPRMAGMPIAQHRHMAISYGGLQP